MTYRDSISDIVGLGLTVMTCLVIMAQYAWNSSSLLEKCHFITVTWRRKPSTIPLFVKELVTLTKKKTHFWHFCTFLAYFFIRTHL